MQNSGEEEGAEMRNNERTLIIIILLSILFTFSFTSSWAANIYVSDNGTGAGTKTKPASFQSALDKARTNGQDDVIFLKQGYYALTAQLAYGSAGTDSKSVTVSGGWNADYSKQSADPSMTVVDGNNSIRLLDLSADAAGMDIVVIIENVHFQRGSSTGSPGAAIRAMQTNGGTMSLTIRNCDFNSNWTNSTGGAIYSIGTLHVADSTFWFNHGSSGGAIGISGTATIEGCDFRANDNIGGWQGSSVYAGSGALKVSRSIFRGQDDGVSSSGPGSPVYVHTGVSLTVTGSVFSINVIDYWGSAIQLWDASGVIRDTVFFDNKAGLLSGFGAVTYLNNSGGDESIEITNCTFYGNTSASGFAGALHLRGGITAITNTIFWSNGTNAGGAYLEYGTATISYSALQGSLAGTGLTDGGSNMVNVDPLFVDAANGDLRLQAGSPCIDSGNYPPDPGWTDFEGDGRIFDGDGDANAVIDRGADEFYPVVASVAVYEPASGDWLPSGGQYLITWNAPATAAAYKISYTLDGGLTWKAIAKGVTDRSYLWQAPIVTKNKKNCLAKVVGFDANNVKVGADQSDKFGIEVLGVTAPGSGNLWNEGVEYFVEWKTYQTMNPVDKVELFYSVDNGTTWKTIGTMTGGNPGTYPWTIPAVKKTKAACKVKVVLKDADGLVVGSDTSDGTFTIVNVIP